MRSIGHTVKYLANSPFRLTAATMSVAAIAIAALPVSAATPEKTPAPVTGDLIGDGKTETVSLTTVHKNGEMVSFTINVGSIRLTIPRDDKMLLDGEVQEMDVVQVDGSLRSHQIDVRLSGADDFTYDYLFGYDGHQLYKIVSGAGWTDIPGNGAIYASGYMDFWSATEKYVVNLKRRSIQNVPQPLYYVAGTDKAALDLVIATATAPFPVLHDRSVTSATVAIVAPNSKFTVLVFAPDTPGKLVRGESGWYLIKTQTGLCGWAPIKTFQNKQNGLTFAD